MPAPLAPDVLARLRDAVGADHVLTSGIEPYAHDETEDFEFPPDAVVRPGSAADVAAVLRIASERRIPVTPQAARTSLSGGALCVRGGLALSMERMARVKDIDEQNLFCVVEPGVITQTLQEEVEKRGLFYGPDPASRGSCTIGGDIGHNAGGPRALKYGVMNDWVTGLEAVLP